MTGVNPDRHPAHDIYAHLPLSPKSAGVFQFVQRAVARASGNSPTFHARSLRTAGISIVNAAMMEHMTTASPSFARTDLGTIFSKLSAAIPGPDVEPGDGIVVEVVDVGTIRTDRTHIVALIEKHPVIRGAEAALLATLYDMGGIALNGNDQDHLSFGSFSRGVPKGVKSALEDNVPNSFVVGLPVVEMPGARQRVA